MKFYGNLVTSFSVQEESSNGHCYKYGLETFPRPRDQLHCLDSSWLITVLVRGVYKGKVGKLYEVLKGSGLVREAGVQDSPAVQRFYSLCQILWNTEPMYKELFPFGLLGCPLRYFITKPS